MSSNGNGRWVMVAQFLAASGWPAVVAASGVTIDPETQAEAEAQSLLAGGADVRMLPCVHTSDPAVRAWAKSLDASVAAAGGTPPPLHADAASQLKASRGGLRPG